MMDNNEPEVTFLQALPGMVMLVAIFFLLKSLVDYVIANVDHTLIMGI